VRATKGFADRAPKWGLGRDDSCLFQRHIDLYVLRERFPECRCADAAAAVNDKNGREDQVRACGGLDDYSDLRGEHGRCPWRCLSVTTAPDVRIHGHYFAGRIVPSPMPPRPAKSCGDGKSIRERGYSRRSQRTGIISAGISSGLSGSHFT
jgi:hypothetical protein